MTDMTEKADDTSRGFLPPSNEDDAITWLQLIRSRRVGATTFGRLMREYGTASAALDALPGIARAAGVKDYTPCSRADAEREYATGCRLGARLLCLGTPAYPARLAMIGDPPPVLWMLGRREHLPRPAVALVGARNASSLGLRMTRALARGLGEQGLAVVSGLARGIDAAAHEATLATGTVAVMAGGVDQIYPPDNRKLAEQIRQRGVLLSEQPLGLAPRAHHFPQRNRIIAGMSLGVVVIEGATKSGSLITATLAAEQGREVMAVPGHPLDPRAGGCNQLIRDGATLVRGPKDVVAALGLTKNHPPQNSTNCAKGAKPSAPPRPAPSRKEGSPALDLSRRILSLLGPSPVAEDQLIRELALPAGLVLPQLVALELDGKVQRQGGGFLSRVQ